MLATTDATVWALLAFVFSVRTKINVKEKQAAHVAHIGNQDQQTAGD